MSIWTQLLKAIKKMRSGYRPERHYMRGPRRADPVPNSTAGRKKRDTAKQRFLKS
ncbi:MAG: hypothetical protein WBA29_08830 [Xanthobacteraceae bacterium]